MNIPLLTCETTIVSIFDYYITSKESKYPTSE